LKKREQNIDYSQFVDETIEDNNMNDLCEYVSYLMLTVDMKDFSLNNKTVRM